VLLWCRARSIYESPAATRVTLARAETTDSQQWQVALITSTVSMSQPPALFSSQHASCTIATGHGGVIIEVLASYFNGISPMILLIVRPRRWRPTSGVWDVIVPVFELRGPLLDSHPFIVVLFGPFSEQAILIFGLKPGPFCCTLTIHPGLIRGVDSQKQYEANLVLHPLLKADYLSSHFWHFYLWML